MALLPCDFPYDDYFWNDHESFWDELEETDLDAMEEEEKGG